MQLPQPGERVVERYVVEALIGQGGFASVFRAWDERLQRPVALKFLTAEGAQYERTREERFVRELQTLASLSHPNIVELYDSGRTESGLRFMALELIEGRDLSEFADFELNEIEVVNIMFAVLGALSHAHDRGVLHRDIKPGNIRVARRDYALVVKVLDWGLTKAIHAPVALTAPGQFVGTLRYMAPELAVGDDAAPHSDLYSVGVVAAELLVGRENARAAGRPFIGPHARVGGWLASIVNRMVEPLADRRYRTAAHVLADLAAMRSASGQIAAPVPNPTLLEHQIPRPIPPRIPSRDDGWDRRKSMVLGMGLLILALAFGAWWIDRSGWLDGGPALHKPKPRGRVGPSGAVLADETQSYDESASPEANQW